MKRLTRIDIVFILILISPIITIAQVIPVQIQGSNRLEYRLADKSGKETFNNWLDVDYNFDSFTTGLRLELHQPSDASESVEAITQRYFQLQKSWLKFRVGNFYKRLGKGLIFQAFEMENIALDRIEQSFIVDRNVDGVLVEISKNWLDLTLLSGKPLWTKSNVIRGGEFQSHPTDWFFLGGSYLRVNTTDYKGPYKTEMSSAQIGLSFPNIEAYAEYARKRVPDDRFLKQGKALYLSTNIYGSNFGLSIEYKNYRNFANLLNNPPTLVKEHFITLLNRHTHTISADDEVGFQLEAVFTPLMSTSFVANYSRAGNHDDDESHKFHEIYGEVKQYMGEIFIAKLIFDQAQDRLVGDKNRLTSALELDYFIDNKNSLLLDIQIQQIEKTLRDWKYDNKLFLIAFSRSPSLTISFQYEYTTDKLSDKKKWLAGNLVLKLAQDHDLFITYGQRRAGLVCSGGYCQIVPEFEGWELRLNSRF